MKTSKVKAAAALDTVLAAISNVGGPTPGQFRIYTGSAPAAIETAATGTLLSTAVIGDGVVDAFNATNTTTLVATGVTSRLSPAAFARDTSIANTGTAGYWRIYDAGGTARLQGSVGTSGAELNLNTTSFVTGGTFTVTAFDITIAGMN